MAQVKFLAIIIALIIIDQLSKYIVRHSGGFYICNPGIAFGIQIPEILFWAFYAIIIGFAFYYFFKKSRFKITNYKLQITNKSQIQNSKYIIPASPAGRHNTYPIILILSGAFSNLIDRLQYGCVIDFIDLKFWPVFNLADAFIVIGGIILLSRIVKRGMHSMEREA